MDKCCAPKASPQTEGLRKVLWIALVLNLSMFFLEFGISFLAQSQSLKADSLDFLGDGLNYIVSLFVLSHSLEVRAKSSIFKAVTMAALGIFVAVEIVISVLSGAAPDAEVMSWVGFVGLVVNGLVTYLLYKFREGDSNMQSVWLCSRNDAIGNAAVILAAIAVFYTGKSWPDLLVAGLMAYLAIGSSWKIIKIAVTELKSVVKKDVHA